MPHAVFTEWLRFLSCPNSESNALISLSGVAFLHF
ncbi:MAG: hypothetical protein ACI85Q_002281, partial [Salibacteraceae bacterium]